MGTSLRPQTAHLSGRLASPPCPATRDHIIVLKDGHVEAEGTLAELLETCEEMQRLWSRDVAILPIEG